MFSVQFFVDDKRLGSALIALVGIASAQPSVTHVVNAVKAKGGKVEAIVKGGSSLDRFAEHLKAFKGKTITARADGRPMMKSIGLAVGSNTYMFTRAVKAGLLKQHGKGSGTTYTVV
jgi:hypothetical protein